MAVLEKARGFPCGQPRGSPSPPLTLQLATYLKAMEEEIKATGNVFEEDEGMLDVLFPKEKEPTV